MRLNTEEFIAKSEELGINYKKYININAYQLEELSKNENFIKKEDKPNMIQIREIGDNPNELTNTVDTFYYFKEKEYIIILNRIMSNFEVNGDIFDLDPYSDEYIEEFEIKDY